MPKVDREFNKDGDFLVDYEEKVFDLNYALRRGPEEG